MEFLTIAGFGTESRDIKLEEVMQNVEQIVDHIKTLYNFLPPLLKRRGDAVVSTPEKARVVMSFLRACARREESYLLCKKQGCWSKDRTYQTTQCKYRLISQR